MTMKMGFVYGLVALVGIAGRAEAVCLGNSPDGMVAPGEGCDDNNTINGDGCSATCEIEEHYSCARAVSFANLDIEDFTGSTAAWTRASDNQSGLQTVNTPAPTVALFGEDAMRGTYAVRMEVKEVTDDDFIGLALGFHAGDQANPAASYLVVDWKQALQDGAPAGLRIAHVRGVPPVPPGPASNNEHSKHSIPQRRCTDPATSCVTQLARGLRHGTTGWQDNTPATMYITYRADRLELRVDGVLELDLRPSDFPGQFPGGVFPSGQMGFYLLSQEQVEYRNLAPRGPSFCNVTSLVPATLDRKVGTPTVEIATRSLMVDANDGLDPATVVVRGVTGGATAAVGADGSITVTPDDPAREGTYAVTVFACDNNATLADCDTTTVTIRYGKDTDDDTLIDTLDNCPLDANADQADQDGDGIGDACDPDLDGDGFDDDLGVSGGGCSTGGGGGGGGGGAGALAVIAGAALAALARRRRRVTALGGMLALGLVVAGSRDASAQVSTRYSAERFELTGHRDGLLGVEWADVRGHLVLDSGLWLGYANDPINVYQMSSGERVGSLVHNRFGGDLVAAVRLWDRLELDLGAPLIFSQSADLGSLMPGGDLSGAGLGDLRIGSKVTIARRGRTAFAAMLGLGLPTSTLDDYGGDHGLKVSPALAVSHGGAAGIRLAANLGYRARPAAQALNLEVDDEVYARTGAGYRFASSLELDATLDLATGARDMFGAFNRNHAELRGGVSYDVTPAVRLFGAAGAGLAEGFGTPDWRALAGVRLGRLGAGPARRALPEPSPLPESRPLPEPALDRDGDGILDAVDRCPTEAEDLDGFEDTDGCPDPDNDHDGVLDADDKCPAIAGVAAMEGCPDPDRDGDTVPDRLDNCPDEAGPVENQGCKKQQLVKIADGKLEILDIVYFAFNDSVIQPRSYQLLDDVARVLNAHPELARIRVEGHSDDQGDDGYNKKLSQRRAESVRAYLIQKSVGTSRLEAVGFGEERPKADNATAEGRAINRRVEFVTLEKAP